MSTMLRGIKLYTKNINVIVTVADDGGGSGMIREELNILPPGDIRNCLTALADTEPLMKELFRYRFKSGRLEGQSFGNLFLAAMCDVSGDFVTAIEKMSSVLAVTGNVLPVTKDDVDGIAFALAASAAKKVYVCNVMTQPGETDGFSAYDHVAAIEKHMGGNYIDYCIANSGDIPPQAAVKYEEQNSVPVRLDKSRFDGCRTELIEKNLVFYDKENLIVRHDYVKLAREILRLCM